MHCGDPGLGHLLDEVGLVGLGSHREGAGLASARKLAPGQPDDLLSVYGGQRDPVPTDDVLLQRARRALLLLQLQRGLCLLVTLSNRKFQFKQLKETMEHPRDHNGEVLRLAEKELLVEFEAFLGSADVEYIAELCFLQGYYKAAKIAFTYLQDNSNLALCHVRLEEYREAVEAAAKVDDAETWKKTCFAFLDASEITFANTCAIEATKSPELVIDTITRYADMGILHVVTGILNDAGRPLLPEQVPRVDVKPAKSPLEKPLEKPSRRTGCARRWDKETQPRGRTFPFI